MTTNQARGRDSHDMVVDDSVIEFVNRNITAYPTEVGSAKFDLVPVQDQKDIMVNAARRHAQQEYDRIMELVPAGSRHDCVDSATSSRCVHHAHRSCSHCVPI